MNAKRIETTRATRELAEQRLDAERKRFEVGMSTSFLVIQAQRDLAQATTNELSAVLAYDLSLVDFEALQQAGPASQSSAPSGGSFGQSAAASGGGAPSGSAGDQPHRARHAARAPWACRRAGRAAAVGLRGERRCRACWRVRKNRTSIDAHIQDSPDSSDVEIRFFYDGALVYVRRWPSREQALVHAGDQLRELQRAGWNTLRTSGLRLQLAPGG